LDGGSNPVQTAAGLEIVQPGDHLPGIPAHRGNLVVGYQLTDRWQIGGSAVAESGQFRFGDEENADKKLGGYVVVNLNTSYQVTDHVTLFALVNNVTDRRYDTYGSFADVSSIPWPNVPGGVTDPRTASPGAPISGYGGVRIQF
jgi:outer membrane receptor protein involved in Fe transport